MAVETVFDRVDDARETVERLCKVMDFATELVVLLAWELSLT